MDLNSNARFQTKQQLLHRLQEGISFDDGVEYSPAEYLSMASERTMAWKGTHYPDHDLLWRHSAYLSRQKLENEGVSSSKMASISEKLFTPENIERDYWNIVEKSKEFVVEYGNDVDTQIYGSGFPLSERGRALNCSKKVEKIQQPEPKFGDEDYYKETWWNLNNIPCAPDSVLRHVKVGITGISTLKAAQMLRCRHRLKPLPNQFFYLFSRCSLDVLWRLIYDVLLAQ